VGSGAGAAEIESALNWDMYSVDVSDVVGDGATDGLMWG
jgi:hypothetical protein